MTTDLIAHLRAATEDDVAAALCDSYIPEVEDVGRDKLLEFWNCMLDRFIGERDD